MSRGSRLGARGSMALLSSMLAWTIACGPSAPPARDVLLREITLPDISAASQPVQEQLRDAYAAMQQKVANPTAGAEERALAYGEMGKLFLATEYLDAAESCFADAMLLGPDDLRWPYFEAHVYRRRNQLDKAAVMLELLLLRDPKNVAALVWLADIRLLEGRPEAAETLLAKALALAPREAAALDRSGRAALARRDYAAAVKNLTSALELQPQASSLHYPLSLAYRGLGDTRQADAHLRLRGDVAVALNDPLMQQVAGLLQNSSAAEVRGAEALAQRRWADAVAELRQAIALAPDNAFAHLNLGTALYETNDSKGALAEFQTAVRLSPGLSKAHYAAGIVLEAAGRDAEAIAELTNAVATEPASVEAHMSLADALRRTGRNEESLPHYSEVISRSPAVSQAQFGYAMALVRLGRYKEARDRLDFTLKTYPDQPGIAHALARTLAAAPDDTVRDGPRALALMQPLVQTQRTIETAQTMAMALAEVGRFEDAAQWQRDAMAAAAQSNRRDLNGRLSENLSRYERRLPCRVPWPENDPVFRPRPSP